MKLALQIAVLSAAGYARGEIARMTGARPVELRDAWARLERVSPQIDRDSDF